MRYKTLKYILILASILIPSISFAQWECRSRLAGNLDPIKEGSNVSWAGELVGSYGYLTNGSIASGMGFAAFDYTKNNHQLYFEGGLKYWNKNDYDLEYSSGRIAPGLREFSYSYSTPSFNLTAGLQQMQLNDYFLLNERAVGLDISKSINGYDLRLNTGTVMKNFARNGIFCSNCFLYDIVPSRTLPLGTYLGESNFAAFSFTKDLTATPTASSSEGGEDEFEAFDEFESFEDEESNTNTRFLKSYGAVLYSEFGPMYAQSQIYGGLTAELSLGNLMDIKAEGIYQYVENNEVLLYYVKADKEFTWKSGNTTLINASFLSKSNISENAIAMPRFANLFMGEVLRMDMVDLPLFASSIKHSFTEQELSLKLRYVHQLEGLNMRELDFSVGKNFLDKKIRLTLIGGQMISDELNDWSSLGRLELRIFF